MTVAWVWAGAATTEGFQVRAKVTGSSTRLAVSTSVTMSDPTYFGPVTPTGEGIATLDATDLVAATAYHYAIEDDSALDTEHPGRIRTAPTGPASFKFCAASCAEGDGVAFDRVRSWLPSFFVHLGDFNYLNTGEGVAEHRAAYDTVLAGPRQAALYRSTNLVLGVDDHEIANDVDAETPGVADWQQVYREIAPAYDLPSTTDQGIWQSFVWGRLRVILTDVRTERSPKSDTDDEDKIVLSAEQEAWFMAECLAAKAAGQAICWANTYAWIQVPVEGGDKWGGYTTARQRLADFFDTNDLGPLMFIVSGDAHMLAMDDGSNNDWGGFPVFQFAALDSGGTEAGGPYSEGKQAGTDQFGVIKITDHGHDMTVTGLGISAGDVWHQMTFTIPLPAVPFTPTERPWLGPLGAGGGRQLVA